MPILTITRNVFRSLTALSLLCGLCAPIAASAAPATSWTVEQLMSELAKHPTGKARFVETKTIAILGNKAVESSGELVFIPPSHLEKRTLKPKPELMVLDGNALSLTRNQSTHTVQMQDYPDLLGFIESIRGTLAGDRRALEKVYILKLEGKREQWHLFLTPYDSKMQEVIEKIKISGSQNEVRAIEIFQKDHDRSLMKITREAAR